MKTISLKKLLTVIATFLTTILLFSFLETSSFNKSEIKYKNSIVSYYGNKNVTNEDLLKETKEIDIADRRFETKWLNKDPKGISEEYTSTGAVFMKPGVKPRLGRTEIEKEFSSSVKTVDRVEFFQDELQFFGEMDVAFQRCHMLGYVNSSSFGKRKKDNGLLSMICLTLINNTSVF